MELRQLATLTLQIPSGDGTAANVSKYNNRTRRRSRANSPRRSRSLRSPRKRAANQFMALLTASKSVSPAVTWVKVLHLESVKETQAVRAKKGGIAPAFEPL